MKTYKIVWSYIKLVGEKNEVLINVIATPIGINILRINSQNVQLRAFITAFIKPIAAWKPAK